MGLVRTVAPHREGGLTGKRRKEREQPSRLGAVHFGAISLRESTPGTLIGGMKRLLDQGFRRRKLREPYIVEIARRMLGLRHAAWRTPHGPQAQPLTWCSGTAQAHDANSH